MATVEVTNYEAATQSGVRVSYSGKGYLATDGVFLQIDTDGADINDAPEEVVALEVHDEEFVSYKEPQLHPLIIWQPVASAEYYAIYQTPPGEAERLIYNASQNTDVDFLSQIVPLACVEGWHFFRVQAVDSVGNEATVEAFPEYVYDLPDAVEDMSIAGTGGSFTITIEE